MDIKRESICKKHGKALQDNSLVRQTALPAPGRHRLKPGPEPGTGAFPIYTHPLPSTPALKQCPISLALGFSTAWGIMPMQHRLDSGTGVCAEPLFRSMHLCPRVSVSGYAVPAGSSGRRVFGSC